jgi:hypothetical protein
MNQQEDLSALMAVLNGTTSQQPYDLLTHRQGHSLGEGLNRASAQKCSPNGGSGTSQHHQRPMHPH